MYLVLLKISQKTLNSYNIMLQFSIKNVECSTNITNIDTCNTYTVCTILQ